MTLWDKIHSMNKEQFAKWMASGNASCLSCAYRNTHKNKIECGKFSVCFEGYKLMLSMELDDIKQIEDTMNILEFLDKKSENVHDEE